MSGKDVNMIMKARLNMSDISTNYGKKEICTMCNEDIETIEHLFLCTRIPDEMKVKASM